MSLRAGTVIHGKWTQEIIRVISLLGAGANGQVYLVKTTNGEAAMKVCEKSGDVALEWSLLEQVQTIQSFPKPIFIDDALNHSNLYFYVMERVLGEPLAKHLGQLSPNEVRQLSEVILRHLERTHRQGLAFCDLKPDNVLVGKSQVRFVDVGGMTQFGRSVRQFTPFYDRAFWGLGSRKADPEYDLSALALALICSATEVPKQLPQWNPADRQKWLQKAMGHYPDEAMRPLLSDVLAGKVQDANTWQRRLQELPPVTERRHVKISVTRTAPNPGRSPSKRAVKRSHSDWSERMMWVAVSCASISVVAAWTSALGWW